MPLRRAQSILTLAPLIATAGCGAIVAGAPGDAGDGDPGDGSPGDGAGLPAGLVAWYPMNAIGAGSTVNDATDHGHIGRCASSCPTAAAGQVGGALRFDGSAVIHVPSTPELATTAGFTIAAWVVPPSATRDRRRCPVNKPLGPGGLDSWSICLEPTGQLAFYSSAGAAGDTLTSALTLSPDAWHHVAITWDGHTKQVFVDGVADARRAQPIAFDTSDVVIGADLDAGSPVAEFAGLLDELRIYDHALDNAELAALAR